MDAFLSRNRTTCGAVCNHLTHRSSDNLSLPQGARFGVLEDAKRTAPRTRAHRHADAHDNDVNVHTLIQRPTQAQALEYYICTPTRRHRQARGPRHGFAQTWTKVAAPGGANTEIKERVRPHFTSAGALDCQCCLGDHTTNSAYLLTIASSTSRQKRRSHTSRSVSRLQIISEHCDYMRTSMRIVMHLLRAAACRAARARIRALGHLAENADRVLDVLLSIIMWNPTHEPESRDWDMFWNPSMPRGVMCAM